MASFGNRGVSYTPFFAEGMGQVADAITARRERGRERAINEKAELAFMGDPQALQDLAREDPELAMQVEKRAQGRQKIERETEIEKDTAFQEDTQRIMQQISQFETFEDAMAYGQRMTGYLQQKYPQRSQAQGAPSEFTPEAFNEIKTIMQGSNLGKTVGVPFRATGADGKPYMAQNYSLPNGGSVTRALTDPEGNRITPAEYDVDLTGQLAGTKAEESVRGTAEGTIATAGDVASAETQADAAATAQVDLPQFVQSSRQVVETMNDIRSDPALETVTGLSAWLDVRNAVPGTEAYDLKQKLEQVKGDVFRQAFQSLKGGGQITEFESQSAAKAIARLDAAQSKESYLEALDDLEDAIRSGVAKMERAASGDFSYEPLPPRGGDAGGGGEVFTRDNPAPMPTDQAGYDALPPGTFYMGSDNKVRRKK